MDLLLVGICLLAVVGLYFYNNPLKHDRWFMLRRFINWFPLGMSYAFLYMGRYNLTVSKNALGTLMTKENFGVIFGVGTAVYAMSFLLNGPFVDRIGGRKGIIVAVLGSAVANMAMGVLTYLALHKRLAMNLTAAYTIVYAINMYFQSYGAVSIIKVKAYWFHVRERGVFGAIFGTLISFGVYFAFDWGEAIVKMTKAGAAETGFVQKFIRTAFALEGSAIDGTWAVFFIPAVILVFWAVLDAWLIRDTPEEANFPHFDTHDASSGEMHIEFTAWDLLKRVFGNPLMLMFAFVELTSGVLRNGIMSWYKIFAKEVPGTGAEIFNDHWGLWLCIFGIVGGFTGGLLSDKVFHSRRGPPAAILCGLMIFLTITMALFLYASPFTVALCSLMMTMAVIGVHSLMSGTAAADFGGRKATATCSGIIDGFVYLGSSIQSFGIGYLTPKDHAAAPAAATGFFGHFAELSGRTWLWWPLFLVPFAILGTVLAIRIWHELPEATKRYIAHNERKQPPKLSRE